MLRKIRTAFSLALLAMSALRLAAQSPAPAASSKPRAAPKPPAAAVNADSVSVNKFMWYSPATQTVHLKLSAALGSINGGMNFNGNAGGSATITIPVGWKVRSLFTNLDAIPHSAIIIANQQPLPTIPQIPAFGAAYTRDLTAGLSTDQTDDMNFKAAPAGKYILVCGVPGHGPSGMWIWVVVSAGATVPAYQM